jgi:hypothetical protein
VVCASGVVRRVTTLCQACGCSAALLDTLRKAMADGDVDVLRRGLTVSREEPGADHPGLICGGRES